MVSLRPLALLLAAVPHLSLGDSMTCGTGVPLCGVLTLETGLGSGVYQSKTAHVHGLWPETGSYGTSKCIKPKNTADPTKVYDCYTDDSDTSAALSFQTHEWEKHGQCAGVQDVDDFFGQVCALSKAPLAVLETAKEGGKNFAAMTQALKDSGYPVWGLDSTNDQIELSACAGNDGKWILAQMADFTAKCGGSSPGPSPGPSPPVPSPPAPTPAPSGGSCSPGKKGPACKKDGDCSGLSGCVRCASSGFCTDQKIPTIQV